MNGHPGFVASVIVLAAILVCAPLIAGPKYNARAWLNAAAILAALLFALMAGNGVFAYLAIALATVIHAANAWRQAPTGALYLLLSAAALVATALAVAFEADTFSFVLSCVALALRAGLAPFHTGVAEMSMEHRDVQIQQSSSLLVLVLSHLYYMDHLPVAMTLAPYLVVWGAAMTLIYALTALAQRELGGLFRSSTLMHAGMLLAGVGGAGGGGGHYGSALLVAVTVAFALGGMGIMLNALESRIGKVSLESPPSGRARAFPRLAAAFAFFAASGVGMPGTAGFISDDVLMHSLWLQSSSATIVIIFASAILAVATLSILVKAFFGPPLRSHSPDLMGRERFIAIAMILLLLGLGLTPQLLVGVTELVLGSIP